MKHFISLALLLVLTSIVLAQSSYQPGYYTDNDGQKFEVLVLEKKWDFTPQKFSIKSTLSADPVTIKMDDIAELQVGNLKFAKFQVDIDRSSELVDKMDNQPNPIFKKESLVLQVVVEGDPSLYYYYDDTGLTRFFYSYKGGGPKQLVYKSYRVNDGIIPGAATMESTIRINKQYRQQLLNEFRALQVTSDGVKNLKYVKSELRRFFQDVNRRNKTKSVVYKDTQGSLLADVRLKGIVDFSDGTGSSIDAFEMEGSGRFDRFQNFSAAVELEVLLNTSKKSLGIFLEPTFYRFESSAFQDTGDSSFDKTLSVESWGIQINTGIKGYAYSQNQLNLFGRIGYSGYFENKNASLTLGSNNRLWSKTGHTFLLGTGVEYKMISLEYRHYGTRKLINDPLEVLVEYQRNSILVGVKIF